MSSEILILSYNRPECKTAVWLEQEGIPFTILVHDKEQAKLYERWDNRLHITNSPAGRYYQIVSACAEFDRFVTFIDDDIVDCEEMFLDGDEFAFRKSIRNLVKFINQDYYLMRMNKLPPLGCFSKTTNRMWRKNGSMMPAHKMTNLSGEIMLTDTKWLLSACRHYDHVPEIFDDLWFSMLCIQEYGNIFVDGRLAFTHERNTGSGGNDSLDKRRKRELADLDYCKEHFPFYSYSVRSDGKGYRNNFKRSYHATR